MELNLEIAFATFSKRYRENVKNQSFDNSRLQAGSPMYYFCHGCYVQVAVKPEGWWSDPPPKYCEACQALAEHGLLTEAQKYVAEHMSQPKIEEKQERIENDRIQSHG